MRSLKTESLAVGKVDADSDVILHDPSKPMLLRNTVCAYCGVQLTASNATKEHVVGRKFVPTGKLDNRWNLILRTCSPCNTRKSELEDDIAAISMQPDVFGKYPVTDDALVTSAKRKAEGSMSRKTKKPVKDSQAQLTVAGQMMAGLVANFSFTGSPQIDDHRIFGLARYHLMAFFFLITYNKDTERGWWWPGEFLPFLHTRRSDWGNASWKGFMQTVSTWDMRMQAATAEDFFRCSIRRHPQAECWSWALEWNKQHRIAGFLGDRSTAQSIVDSLPQEHVTTVFEEQGRSLRFRQDAPLAETEDILFA
jgi:hypothetical protein